MSQKERYPERNAEIRRLYAAGGVSMAELGRKYGVSAPTIRMVINPEINRAKNRAARVRRHGIDDAYTEKVRSRAREYQRRKREAAKS